MLRRTFLSLTAALAPETLSGVLEWVRRHQGARAVPA